VRVDDAFCLARAQMLQLALMLALALMVALVMLVVDMIQRRLARMTRRRGG